jgi:hypothetical protein
MTAAIRKELTTRLAKATGPDRELDCLIAVAVAGFYLCEPRYEGAPPAYGYTDADGRRIAPGQGGDMLVPNYTGSIDAAATLVRKGCTFAVGDLGEDDMPWACVTDESGKDYTGSGATPAIALAIAAAKQESAQ